MISVDSNYKYDELEGFKPFSMSQKRPQPGMSVLTIRKGLMALNINARRYICDKKYIHIFLNTERKKLMICSSDEYTDNALKVNRTFNRSIGIGCVELVRTIESICKYDSSVVALKFTGEPVKTKRNALIFDLTKCVTSKIVKRSK